MKSLVEVVKIFLEKYFISSVFAFVITIFIYLLLPLEFFPVKKLGILFFLIFIFSIAFLLLQLIIRGYKFCKSKISDKKYKEYQNKQREETNREALEQLWSYIDSLNKDDFLLIQNFLESNNKPIIRNANAYYSGDCLLASNYVHSTIVEAPKEEKIIPHTTIKNGYAIPFTSYTNGKKKYILKDDFYQMLKYSQEKYGRIFHFE